MTGVVIFPLLILYFLSKVCNFIAVHGHNNSRYIIKFRLLKALHATKHLFHHAANTLFQHTRTCGIYGQVGIICFNNTSGHFKFWFIITINYYKGTAVLVLWLLVILLHMCMYSTDCCAAVSSAQGAKNLAVYCMCESCCIKHSLACGC